MPEQSKFSGALSKLKQSSASQPEEIQATTAVSEPAEFVRGKGRPPGKRSDPDFQPVTVLLRKKTKKGVNRILEDSETGKDFSDLIEELLADWMQQRVNS